VRDRIQLRIPTISANNHVLSMGLLSRRAKAGCVDIVFLTDPEEEPK
jgi:hypothetical protein